MSYYIYGRYENGRESFEKICDTFESAVDEIHHLYDMDETYGGIPTYYYMVERKAKRH